MVHRKGIPTVSQKGGNIEVSLAEIVKRDKSNRGRILSRVNVWTKMNMEIISKNGEVKRIRLQQVPVIVNLPVPGRYLRDKEARKSLRVLVRENFQRIKPGLDYAGSGKKTSPYIHQVGLNSSKSDNKPKKSIFKQRKTLYNAPVDWEMRLEDLLVKK